MAFSLRSFFGKDKPDDGPAGTSPGAASPQSHQGGYPFQKSGQSGPFSNKDVFLGASTPANGKSHGSFAGASPFSPAMSLPSTGLTVGDILPGLPQELVKPSAVAPGEPLQIPGELLERALRSGMASLPLFEIYRVCPALFRSAISPYDERQVPLPHHKLGGLTALIQQKPAATPPPSSPSLPPDALFHPSPFHADGASAPASAPAQGDPFSAPTTVTPPVAGVNPFATAPGFTSSTSPFSAPPAGIPANLFAPAQSTPVPAPPPPEAPAAASPFSFGIATPPPPPADTPPTGAATDPLQSLFATAANPAAGQTQPQSWANPFYQAATSVSTSASPSAPAPANPFAAFGTAPLETAKVPDAGPPPAQPLPAFPGDLPPWQNSGLVAQEPPSSPPPAPPAFPEAPATPASTNPFDRIKALATARELPPAASVAPVAATPLSAFPSPEPPAFPVATSSPAASSASATLSANREKAILSLASVLSKCSQQDIGVHPEQIPSWITVGIPVKTLTDQLAGGRVTVKLADIMRALEPEFRSIITPSRGDLVVEIPANDVFHALPSPVAEPASSPAPSLVPEPKPAGVLGTEALAAVADLKPVVPANSPESKAALPSLFAPAPSLPENPTAKLPAGVPWPFEMSAPAAPPQLAPAPPATAFPASIFSVTASDDPPAGVPAFPAAPTPSPALFQNVESLSPPAPAQAPPLRSIKPEAISFGPGVKAEITQQPSSRGSRDRNKQLLLRVLLATEDDLELEDVIRLTGSLPGVSAAVCLRNGVIVSSASNHTKEAESFINQATRIHEHLKPLIQLTGIMDTETLSMKSDQLMASFSLQGDLVLGVLHDPGKNEPTLRERLTLIARELKSVVTP